MAIVARALAAVALILATSVAQAADLAQQEQNKKIVVDFYDKALNQKNFEAAAVHIGPRYTQHNPNAADGPEGLMVCAEFVEPDGSGRPLDRNRVAELDRLAWDRGAIAYARGHVVRLAPPLCITPSEVDQLIAIMADSIAALEKTCVG